MPSTIRLKQPSTIAEIRSQAVHRTVDQPGLELRAGLRVERALPLWSDKLGLIGKADVVEFEADGTPYPVEYKHGSRNKAPPIAACDDVQLAGQAMCLQEMTGHAVPEGALYYASSRRRRIVRIDDALRAQVVEIAAAVRAMQTSGVLPMPTQDERRCKGCSLRDRCQPRTVSRLREPDVCQTLFDPEG